MLAKQLRTKQKNEKGGFLSMLLGTLGTSLLENLFVGKGTIRADDGATGASECTIRAIQNFIATLTFNKFWNIKVLSKWT